MTKADRERKRLEAMVEKAMARRAEMAASGVAAPLQAPALAPSPISADEALASMRARVLVADPASVRAYAFKHEIAPRLEHWRFPARYRTEIADWQCDLQQRVFEKCRRTFTGVGAIVALVGERGTGKTTIAAQLAVERAWTDHNAAEALALGAPFREQYCPYRKLADLVGTFKALYADHGTLDPEALDRARAALCQSADLLCIDEVHECDDLRVKDRLMTDFIDRRYAERRDTLLISNQTMAQFRESTSESVLSRMTEHGVIIECTWPSWREKLKAA
jgi:DNA replication protein DnaC